MICKLLEVIKRELLETKLTKEYKELERLLIDYIPIDELLMIKHDKIVLGKSLYITDRLKDYITKLRRDYGDYLEEKK
jgi:hypothetical protein